MYLYLVQLLLPVHSPPSDIADGVFKALKTTLADRFGGYTAFTQSPAEGSWAPAGGAEQKDQIVVVEVMTEQLDTDWWHGLRLQLERDLKQELIIIRAQQIEML
jgi:hypothetical protein